MKAYLSVCAVYRDEAAYLREWIEFHRLVGVEHFYLYNHASVDDHRGALAPYIEDGIVTLEDWPDVPSVQIEVYNHCLERNAHNSRWIAFIDIDEFLFSPTGRPVSELLVEWEPWPGVAASWANFGTSGHVSKPPGLVIESYLWRSDDLEMPRNTIYKCVIDPQRVTRCLSAHHFDYTELSAVDEQMRPVEGLLSDRALYSRLRINHYYTRSEEECARKYARRRVNDAAVMNFGEAPLERLHAILHDTRDEAIVAYAPAVKEALTGVDERAPFDASESTTTIEHFRSISEPVPKRPPHRFEIEWGPEALRCIEAAIECAHRILPRSISRSRSFDRILDLPCGRGRVLRVLRAAFPEAEITACDIDRDAVDFCAEALDAVPLYSHEDPACIETDATFDLIWCGSLFPHLDTDRWLEFLEFFEVRLRPWGILVFTTAGRYHVTNIGPREHGSDLTRGMLTEYAKRGFSYRDDGHRAGWGTAIASPSWVCRQLEARPGLRLLTYTERGWHQTQDAVSCVRLGPRKLVRDLVEAQPTITEQELVKLTRYDEPTIRRCLEVIKMVPVEDPR